MSKFIKPFAIIAFLILPLSSIADNLVLTISPSQINNGTQETLNAVWNTSQASKYMTFYMNYLNSWCIPDDVCLKFEKYTNNPAKYPHYYNLWKQLGNYFPVWVIYKQIQENGGSQPFPLENTSKV